MNNKKTEKIPKSTNDYIDKRIYEYRKSITNLYEELSQSFEEFKALMFVSIGLLILISAIIIPKMYQKINRHIPDIKIEKRGDDKFLHIFDGENYVLFKIEEIP